MISRVKDLDEVLEYVWQLSQNELYASYPRLNSKEAVQKEIEKAIKLENFNLIAIYYKNELSGVCSYFWKADEKYAQTIIFTISEGQKHVAGKFVDYISEELAGYELFIGLPSTNKNIQEYFEEKNIECIENSIVTHICNLRPYSSSKHEFVKEIQENNFEDYALFHDRYAVPNEMYYNSKNLCKEIGSFRIFVYKQNSEIYGSIFFKVGKEIADIYGLFIDEKHKNKNIESVLLAVKVDDSVDMVHIGYAIGARWWHQGYTTEALVRLVKFFFEEVGVNRIESRHDPLNPNSGKVMLKAGFTYEGTLKRSDHNNQGICDAAYYAVLAEEYFRNT